MPDDTYVFVLLLLAYYENNLTCELVMRGKNLSRSSAKINATVENHINILQDILSAIVLQVAILYLIYLELEELQ